MNDAVRHAPSPTLLVGTARNIALLLADASSSSSSSPSPLINALRSLRAIVLLGDPAGFALRAQCGAYKRRLLRILSTFCIRNFNLIKLSLFFSLLASSQRPTTKQSVLLFRCVRRLAGQRRADSSRRSALRTTTPTTPAKRCRALHWSSKVTTLQPASSSTDQMSVVRSVSLAI